MPSRRYGNSSRAAPQPASRTGVPERSMKLRNTSARDIAVAADSCRFCQMEARRGLVQEVVPHGTQVDEGTQSFMERREAVFKGR